MHCVKVNTPTKRVLRNKKLKTMKTKKNTFWQRKATAQDRVIFAEEAACRYSNYIECANKMTLRSCIIDLFNCFRIKWTSKDIAASATLAMQMLNVKG